MKNKDNNPSRNRLEEGIDDGIRDNVITDTVGRTKSKQITLLIFAVFLFFVMMILMF